MKMSSTYLKLVGLSLFGLFAAFAAGYNQEPTLCAIASTLSFVCWYVAVMLPPCEKYRKGYKHHKNKGSIEL